jgi:hypothetical protein
MQNLQRALSCVLALTTLLLLVRLVVIGMASKCRFLFAFLTILALELVLLMAIPQNRDTYAKVYFVCQFANLLVAYGVVREIFSLALTDRPALAAFGQKVVLLALALAALISAVTLFMDNSVLPGQYKYLHMCFVAERTGNLVLLLLLLMIGFYVTWFPVRLPRNILLYAAGFGVLFLARSIGLLAINLLSPTYAPAISSAMLIAEAACVVAWMWTFRREREDVKTISGHRWNPAEMDRLTQQLDSINTALTRFNHH